MQSPDSLNDPDQAKQLRIIDAKLGVHDEATSSGVLISSVRGRMVQDIMYKFALIILALPLLAHSGDRYTVHFDDKLETVTVEACFDGTAPRELHRNQQAGKFTNWVRVDGRNLEQDAGSARLTLPVLGDNVCIGWQLQLSEALNEKDYRLALRLNRDLLTSGDLWFWRDAERRQITIEVKIPAGMSISTPWKELAGPPGTRLFRPDPTPANWTSRIAIGHFEVQHLPVGGTVLQVAAIGGINEQQRSKLLAWLDESGTAVFRVYGQFPRTKPQILIVPIGSQNQVVPWAHVVRGGGVAAEFFVDETRPLNQLRDDWTATHELSHMLLPYVARRDRWLSEGLASYYQNILRARDGRLSEQQAWQRLHTGFERGRAATRGDTLAEATRSGRHSTMRVYWSGAAMMLQADTELRLMSNGRQSLDSALAGLRDCCLVSNRSWRARELFSELDRITGTRVFSELYREHVTDDEFPDLSDTFERLGLVSESKSIRLDPDAPWGRIRYYIMNG
jgi:hypothetical protein